MSDYIIDFPVNIGEILEGSARKSGRLLAACRTQEISWNGTRAYIVGANTPSFRQQYGDSVKNTDKKVAQFDMHTMPLTVCFRMAREQVEAAKENGTFEKIMAAKMAESLKEINKAVEYGIIHGYDLATGAVLTAYDHVNGSILKAIKTTNKAVTAKTYNDLFIDASVALGDFDTTNFYALPKTFAELYKEKDAQKVVMMDGTLSILGAPVTKLPELADCGNDEAYTFSLIAGDFSKIVWGVKPMSKGIEEVTAGDPDGLGDLGRRRELAYMFDIAYAWGITHPEAFCGAEKDPIVVG